MADVCLFITLLLLVVLWATSHLHMHIWPYSCHQYRAPACTYLATGLIVIICLNRQQKVRLARVTSAKLTGEDALEETSSVIQIQPFIIENHFSARAALIFVLVFMMWLLQWHLALCLTFVHCCPLSLLQGGQAADTALIASRQHERCASAGIALANVTALY